MKKIIFTILVSSLVITNVLTQDDVVLQVFQDQVDAYNQMDVDRMTMNLTEDFKWYYITSDSLILEVEGSKAFHTGMTDYYKSLVRVKATIEDYTIQGDRISFREVVRYTTKSGKSGTAAAMGIYQIKEGKIWRGYYFY